MASRENWADPLESYENTDTWMPSFVKKTPAQPVVNPEVRTLLHYHTKFIFLWFVLGLLCFEV